MLAEDQNASDGNFFSLQCCKDCLQVHGPTPEWVLTHWRAERPKAFYEVPTPTTRAGYLADDNSNPITP